MANVMCTITNDHGKNIVLLGTTIVDVSSHFKSGTMGESARCEGRECNLAVLRIRGYSFYSLLTRV